MKRLGWIALLAGLTTIGICFLLLVLVMASEEG